MSTNILIRVEGINIFYPVGKNLIIKKNKLTFYKSTKAVIELCVREDMAEKEEIYKNRWR